MAIDFFERLKKDFITENCYECNSQSTKIVEGGKPCLGYKYLFCENCGSEMPIEQL